MSLSKQGAGVSKLRSAVPASERVSQEPCTFAVSRIEATSALQGVRRRPWGWACAHALRKWEARPRTAGGLRPRPKFTLNVAWFYGAHSCGYAGERLLRHRHGIYFCRDG
jgi:hypothetical protein